MDRNSTIGLVLIFLLLGGYWFLNQPNEAQLAQSKRYTDSLAQVEKSKAEVNKVLTEKVKKQQDSLNALLLKDSSAMQKKYAGFSQQVTGIAQNITLENKDLKITINTKGAGITNVTLKNYKRHDSSILELFNEKQQLHQLEFSSILGNIKSTDFYWQVVSSSAKSAILRLNYSNTQFIEFQYTLPENGYNLKYNIATAGMNNVIVPNTNVVLNWQTDIPLQEKETEKERTLTTAYFKYPDEKADFIGETKNEELSLKNPTEWVSLKQQFFNTTIMAKEPFLKESKVRTDIAKDANNVKNIAANLRLPYNGEPNKNIELNFYFGPNQFKLLREQNVGLEKIIPLGWGIFGWINRFMIIPVFNFLSGFMSNYGIIILLLTLIIKTLLLPLVYKSYKSTAKMKLLKPEIDAIKEKNKDNMQAVQMENLALYKKAGVNPLGGCLPMLLQMPILVAVFQFVPSAFEFRQQAFLWATDLSIYDSIWNFGKIPIIDTIYGSHVSLFTLLMTVSTLIYTKMNNDITGVNEQMKWISYLMPIVFLGFFNKYPAALSYYYFLSNCVTFTQQWAIKKFVDEGKLMAQIKDAQSKKGEVKKSAFQKRLEEMAKSRGIEPPKKK